LVAACAGCNAEASIADAARPAGNRQFDDRRDALAAGNGRSTA
jgi:hypothetical protein